MNSILVKTFLKDFFTDFLYHITFDIEERDFAKTKQKLKFLRWEYNSGSTPVNPSLASVRLGSIVRQKQTKPNPTSFPLITNLLVKHTFKENRNSVVKILSVDLL